MTTPEMKPLLPCRWCGHTEAQFITDEDGEVGWMLCGKCKASSPCVENPWLDFKGTDEEKDAEWERLAREIWNSPTPQPSSEYVKAVDILETVKRCAALDQEDRMIIFSPESELMSEIDLALAALKSHPMPAKEQSGELEKAVEELVKAVEDQNCDGGFECEFECQHDKRVTKALSTLKSHPTPSGWQGIESAPRGERVLLLWNDNIIGGIFEAHDEDGGNGPEVWSYWTSDGDLLIEDGPDSPTHWHPLPSHLSSALKSHPTPAKEKP